MYVTKRINCLRKYAPFINMDYGRRWRVVLVGHSYIRRLGQYIYTDSRRRNLMLSNVDVSVAGYGGATVSRLYDELHSNIVADADVIFVHIGENDYEHHEPMVTAQRIMSLATDMVCTHNARCVIISELVRFAVHRSDWCIRVNRCLRQLSREVPVYNIRLWRQRRGLYNPRSCLFDRHGVHLNPVHMQVYWSSVRYAVLSCMRRQR